MDRDLLAEAITRLQEAADLGAVQQIVRTTARAVAAADGATFVLRDVDYCFYADEDAISPLWKGQRFPLTRCITGWAMLHAQAVVIPDLAGDDRVPLESYRPTFVRSLAVVPIGDGTPIAAIGAYWARPHTATVREMAGLEALAGAAGAAINRIGLFGAAPPFAGGSGAAQAGPVERVPRSLDVSEDHERIARDLHDTVLQQMFATGLRLQALQGTLADPVAAQAIDEVIADIDGTIRDLRGVIFGLEYGHERLGGLAGEILAVAASAARALGFSPAVTIDGPLDDVPDEARYELAGALREMLSNVSRHAGASRVEVECSSGSSVRLRVTDDGVGLPAGPAKGNGLANLAARARKLGGSFTIGPDGGRGTTAVWSVPLRLIAAGPGQAHHGAVRSAYRPVTASLPQQRPVGHQLVGSGIPSL